MVIEETINCINSILDRFDNQECNIVVVDNASSNGSGKELESKYIKKPKVDIIINSENAGFARGNNFGYKYILQKYNPDFIIVMNNDVEINDKDFLKKIKRLYDEEKFYILGPDIYSSTFEAHQSPKRLKSYTFEEIKKANNNYSETIKHDKKLRIKCFFKRNFWLRKRKYQFQRSKIDYSKKYYNVPLHGACLIYSRLYTQKYDTAFYPKTFFYYECEILDYICNKDGIKTVYSPEIKIIHHQNVSTNTVYNDIYSKTVFATKCNIESTNAFLELIEANKDIV